MPSTFKYTVNGGEEKEVTIESGVYKQVAAAIPAVIGLHDEDYPLTIKIWVDDLLPDYGPYDYYIDQIGGAVGHIIHRPKGPMIIYS